MIRIEVKSTATNLREGVSQRSGKQYKLVEQTGWLHGSKDYPTEVSFILQQGQVPFAPGFYEVGPECVRPDRFGRCGLELQYMLPLKPKG